jgi:hypothetical protein
MRIGTDGSRSDGFKMNAGDGRRTLPQWDHSREIEWGDADDDAERLVHRIEIDARAGALGIFALDEMRNAAGEFRDFEAALNVALGVGERLAVLGGEEPGEFVILALDEFQEPEHDPGAPLRIGGRPTRESRLCIGNRFFDFRLIGQRDLGLHFAGIGVEDVARTSRCSFDCLAADEMTDLTHCRVSLDQSHYRRTTLIADLWPLVMTAR